MTVKLNELQPVGEVASNPVQSHATYTIVFEFVKQNIMIDGIKGLRKIKEKANGIFIAIKSEGKKVSENKCDISSIKKCT